MVAISGNGCTDFIGMSQAYYEVQCMDYGFPEVTSVSCVPTWLLPVLPARLIRCSSCRECVRMKQLVPRCQKKIKESCVDVLDPIGCSDAFNSGNDVRTILIL